MKKVLLLGVAALFSLAFVVSSCSKDDDEKCVTCTEGDQSWEVCWEEGKALDYTAKMLDFITDHPSAICEEVTDF